MGQLKSRFSRAVLIATVALPQLTCGGAAKVGAKAAKWQLDASIEVGFRSQLRFAQQCTELLHPSDVGSSTRVLAPEGVPAPPILGFQEWTDLQLDSGLSLGNPKLLVDKLEVAVTGAFSKRQSAHLSSEKSNIYAIVDRELNALRKDAAYSALCEPVTPNKQNAEAVKSGNANSAPNDEPNQEGLTAPKNLDAREEATEKAKETTGFNGEEAGDQRRTSKATRPPPLQTRGNEICRLVDALSRTRSSIQEFRKTVAPFWQGLQEHRNKLESSCSSASFDVDNGAIPTNVVVPCVAALVSVVSAARKAADRLATEAERHKVKAEKTTVEKLTGVWEALRMDSELLRTVDHKLPLALEQLRNGLNQGAIDVSGRVVTAWDLTQLEKKLLSALATTRAAGSFIAKGKGTLDALLSFSDSPVGVKRLVSSLAQRGLFDSEATALLYTIEPALRRLDRLLDLLDEKTYGLSALAEPHVLKGIKKVFIVAAVELEAILERNGVPVLSLVRASCRTLQHRKLELASSRVVPLFHHALVEAHMRRRKHRMSAREAPPPGKATGTATAYHRSWLFRSDNGQSRTTDLAPSQQELADFHAHVLGDFFARVKLYVSGVEPADEDVLAVAPVIGAQLADDTRRTNRTPPGRKDVLALVLGLGGNRSVSSSQSTVGFASVLWARSWSTAVTSINSGDSTLVLSTGGAGSTRDTVETILGAQKEITTRFADSLQIALDREQELRPAFSFCAAANGIADVACDPIGGGVFAVDIRIPFEAGRWSNSKVKTAIVQLRRRAKQYAVAFTVDVHGYASSEGYSCKRLLEKVAAKDAFRVSVHMPTRKRIVALYTNTRNPIVQAGSGGWMWKAECADNKKAASGNELLSYLRAVWTAHQLEDGSRSSFAVARLCNHGTIVAKARRAKKDRRVHLVVRPKPAVDPPWELCP